MTTAAAAASTKTRRRPPAETPGLPPTATASVKTATSASQPAVLQNHPAARAGRHRIEAPSASSAAPTGKRRAEAVSGSARRAIFARPRRTRRQRPVDQGRRAQTLIGRGIENDDDPHALDDAGSDPAPASAAARACGAAPDRRRPPPHPQVLKTSSASRARAAAAAGVDAGHLPRAIPDAAPVQPRAESRSPPRRPRQRAKALRTESRTVARGGLQADRQRQQIDARATPRPVGAGIAHPSDKGADGDRSAQRPRGNLAAQPASQR